MYLHCTQHAIEHFQTEPARFHSDIIRRTLAACGASLAQPHPAPAGQAPARSSVAPTQRDTSSLAQRIELRRSRRSSRDGRTWPRTSSSTVGRPFRWRVRPTVAKRRTGHAVRCAAAAFASSRRRSLREDRRRLRLSFSPTEQVDIGQIDQQTPASVVFSLARGERV